ncbi:hypothetical protein FQN49_006225, partial [Arthroderma sp. PD_2]
GVDMNIKDTQGYSPLSWAAKNGYDKVVDLLLSQERIETDVKDKDRRTPLLWAACIGHDEVVKLLLAKEGVEVDLKDKDGKTPLLWAIQNKHEKTAALLVGTNRVDVNSKDSLGHTPLSLAIETRCNEVIELLLGEGEVKVNLRCGGGTALFVAVKCNVDIVELLLAKGEVETDIEDSDGDTPLYYAISKAGTSHDYTAMAKLLLAKGANANAKARGGWTPLHKVAYDRHLILFFALLEVEGLEINPETDDGNTPLDMALRFGYFEIAFEIPDPDII